MQTWHTSIPNHNAFSRLCDRIVIFQAGRSLESYYCEFIMYILLFVSAIRSLVLFPIAVNVKFHYFKAGVFNESSKKSGSYISFPVVVRKIYMAPIINIKFPNFNNYIEDITPRDHYNTTVSACGVNCSAVLKRCSLYIKMVKCYCHYVSQSGWNQAKICLFYRVT